MSDTASMTGVFDFHTHTFFSDGALSPMEQARRAAVAGYSVLGITDHMGIGGVGALIDTLKADREIIERHWTIRVIVGVELTHVPAESIGKAAELARKEGAEIVIVHGETPVEPVPSGTNSASIECGLVDVLAHPGMLTIEQAELAVRNDVFIEITARRGHSLTNGHVARICRNTGARMLVNSDAHEPSDLLSITFQESVACGAGIAEEDLNAVLRQHPLMLWDRVLQRRSH